MTRAYRPEPVPRDVLQRVLDAGRRAPSAGFTQGWSFLVLDQGGDIARFWTLTSYGDPPAPGTLRAGMRQAPVIVVVLANPQAYLDRYSEPDKAARGLDRPESWPVPYWDIDCAFATMAILLAAVDAGLGSAFFGIFHGERQALDWLGVPSDMHAIGAITLGYADHEATKSQSLLRGRKPFESVVHWGRWAYALPGNR